MPGNEVGDRVHNFFGQENLYHGQHQSQAADGNWPGLNNNLWVRNQREIGAPFSNLKNYNAHQSESEGQSQPSQTLHGLNFSQSYISPEIGRNESQNPQLTLNGYAAAHPLFHSRQVEANFLGADAVTPRSLSIQEAQQANNLDLSKKNVARLETADSPVNFDFFGGQQQLSGRNPSVTQFSPKHQPGNPDMQLLQQQAILSHIQELQRQHQFQQQEARHHGSLNQIHSNSKQATGNHSATLIDGIPVSDLSASPWQSEHMVSNPNSRQHNFSTPMQSSSSGFIFPTEHQQALRLMGLIPEQVDQSLYGVPISTSSSFLGSNSLIPTDKSAMQQLSVSNNAISGTRYTGYTDQDSMQDGMVLRQDLHGKSMFGLSVSQGLNGGLNSENSQHLNLQQRNAPIQEFNGRQEFPVQSESQEKTMAQVAPSHNVASLDPTEEKILYGSDDNLWDAFGSADNVASDTSNVADGGTFTHGFSFLQSGSWSALMQSAVAETSSGDVGQQEGWSGLSYHNSGPPNGNRQPPDGNDSGKLQPVWVDNNAQTASTLNSRHPSLSAEAKRPNSYINSSNVPGFQQPGQKSSFPQIEGFQNNSAQRLTQPLEGERKWMDRSLQQKSPAEGRKLTENAGHALGVEINADNMSGSWIRQQNLSYNSQACKPNGWNYIEPMFSHGGNSMKNHENHGMSPSLQGGDQKRSIHEEMVSATFKQNHDLVPNPTDELQNSNPAVEYSQVYNEGSSLLNNARSLRDDQGSQQHIPNNRNHAFWKDATCTTELKGSGFVTKYQHHLDKGSQFSESSGNHCLEKETTETQEIENSNPSDALTSSGSKQKIVGNTIRKPSVTRRFQYHPMGNLDMDVEPSFGTSHATQPQVAVQQSSHGFKGSEASNFMQSRSGHVDGFSMGMEKSDTRGFGEIPSKRMLPPFGSRFSSSLDKLAGHDARHVTLPSSQNMLELLHKVDQPREHGNATRSPSYRNPSSEMVEAETSDGSVGQTPRNQSSDSQVFGLHLGPPQRMSMQDAAISSHSPSHMVMSSPHSTSDMGERGMLLAPTASRQRDLRSNTTGPSGHTGNKTPYINSQGSLPTASQSAFPYGHLHNQHAIANPSVNVFSDRLGFRSRNFDDSSELGENSQVASADISRSGIQMNLVSSTDRSQLNSGDISHGQNSTQFVSELGSMPISQRAGFSNVSSNEWENVTTQKPSLHVEPSKAASDLFKSHLHMDSISDKSFSGPKKLDNLEKLELESMPPGENSMNTQCIVGREKQMHESPGKQVSGVKSEISEHIIRESDGRERDLAAHYPLGASPSNSVTTRVNIEAFGHSLHPNISSQQQYSLLHQIQTMRGADNDPTNRSGKRLKGPDCGLGSQQVALDEGQLLSHGHNNVARELLLNHASISRTDAAMVSLPSKKGDAYASSSDIASSMRGEHSQISPQMAPSWFDQYGTFKNGQTLTVYPGSENATMKSLDQPLSVEKSPDGFSAQNSLKQAHASADGSEHGNVGDISALTSIEHRNFCSSQSVPLDSPNNSLAALRQKKRKNSASELLPWREEMTLSFRRLQDISMANVDWAQATNRLIEKKEDEVEMSDDGPMIKLKKRLGLTTQLVQKLLRPPSFATLSSDASLHYESVAYVVARLALGDACNIVSCTGTDDSLHSESRNLLSEAPKILGKPGDPKITDVVDDFIRRARKMENDLLRVEKRASILDLRVECQDLEKFSVINRFAKFHSRGQVDGGEASSSSDVTTMSQKSFPQRYVTALPIPRNLPDRVQCLSL